MTQQEKDLIRDTIRQVYESLRLRCLIGNASSAMTSCALYSVQDFCGEVVHTDDNGLELPNW